MEMKCHILRRTKIARMVFGELDAEKTIWVHTRTQEEGGEKLLIRIDGAIRSLVCGQVSDQTPGEHPPRESISGSLFLVLKSGMGKIKSCGNELKHPNLCYCSVGQREANCKEFVLRAAETRICCFRNISGISRFEKALVRIRQCNTISSIRFRFFGEAHCRYWLSTHD
ncbi:uncharacterized protein LOC103980041 isoform X3 [Musa acuminata AAA Group]|uniref:uncharacterized protein LOC103980041 isoform X3 n=1 Tax=Musa acuminata AAA Group TaxID=214697 RepID=UPI0031D44536